VNNADVSSEPGGVPPSSFRVALLVISDKAAAGLRLPVMREGLPPACTIAAEHVLPDDRSAIERLLVDLTDRERVDCIVTSGGTGLGPRDVTPEATKSVADYEVPGIAETLRARSVERVPTAMLSRAVAAVRKRTLIVNLPGNPNAVRETLAVLSPVLPHALSLLRGEGGDHEAPKR
jgi:molybdopterin adenylyltransferase